MKKLLLIIGLIPFTLGLNAQQSQDYGVFLGMTGNHLYNILPVPEPGTIGYAAGGYYRYNLNPRYAIRGGVNLGMDMATFIPSMVDVNGLFEFNFHALNPRRENAKVSSYIGTGLSYMLDFDMANQFASQPQSPSKTEFFLRNIAIPFNLGVRYNATPHLTLGLEWALRKRFENDNTDIENPVWSFNKANWRSHIGIMVGYSIAKTCKTCPFYEKERNKSR
ncbi:MAG: DUF6089 family protein [Bacteroidota bacterium]